jgi:hypothetical protein
MMRHTGGSACGGHLDEVEVLLAGTAQGLGERDDAHLVAVGVHEPDARDLDVRVQPALLVVDAAASWFGIRSLVGIVQAGRRGDPGAGTGRRVGPVEMATLSRRRQQDDVRPTDGTSGVDPSTTSTREA